MAAQISPSQLPQEVVACLENARYLHLATCHNQEPHISLMSYTYLPSTPYSSRPTIIMTTPPSSRKTSNIFANSKVSLLVHDWTSHRPPTLDSPESLLSTSPEGRGRSGLASLLLSMNSASLSRLSVNINGVARILDAGSEEEAWFKARHKEHNTFGDMDTDGALGDGDGGANCYIEGNEVKVVVVEVRDGRISDYKGMIKDWSVQDHFDAPLVNGL